MRRRATKPQIALTIGLLTAMVAAGYWWFPHIWWSYVIARRGAKIRSVPVSALHAPGQTKGWFTCRAGALSFKLPPDMIDEAERSASKENNAIIIKTRSSEVQFHVPAKAGPSPHPALVEAAARLHRSPMQITAETYRASTDDFRWTMSRAELERHQMLVNLGLIFYPHTAGIKVESLFEGPLEGLLMIRDRTHAVFEWHAKSEAAVGYLSFTSTENDLNLDHLRDICASVSCDDSKLGPQLTKGELDVLANSLEFTKE
jgi:hypothetical protein